MDHLPVARDGRPYSGSDRQPEYRVARLDEDMSKIKGSVIHLERGIDDLRAGVAQVEATLPYVATRIALARKPSKAYLWGALGVVIAAYASGLATLAVLK